MQSLRHFTGGLTKGRMFSRLAVVTGCLRGIRIRFTDLLVGIFTTDNNSVFLATETLTRMADGVPKSLRDHSLNAGIQEFLTRGSA